MSCDPTLYFVGDWSGPERCRLQSAIVSFEYSWVRSSRSSSPEEARWIVVQESPYWGLYYFAHRLGTYDSLTGRSATELAEVIEASADELSGED